MSWYHTSMLKLVFSIVVIAFSILFAPPLFAQNSVELKEVVHGLQVPWSLAFVDDDSFFVSERTGAILYIAREDNRWKSVYVYRIPDVSEKAEAGLMGIALHPGFDTNRYV